MATADDFRFREVPQVSEKSSLIGKCLFCHLGEQDKRGVLCTTTTYKTRGSTSEQESYSCNLGEIGKGCTIPKAFELAYRGTQVGQAGDGSAWMHKPIA